MRVGRPGEGLEKSSRLDFLLFLKDTVGHLANLCFTNEDTSQKKPGDRTELQAFLTADGAGLEPRSSPFLTLKGGLPEGGSDFRRELGRYLYLHVGTSLAAQTVKCLPTTREIHRSRRTGSGGHA